MREHTKIWVAVYAAGVMAGILCAEFDCAGISIMQMGIFAENHLTESVKVCVPGLEYIWYIVRMRLLPLCILTLAGAQDWKKTSAVLFFLWTGFLAGVLFCAAVLQLGIKGIFICVLALLPHTPFYVAAYVAILIYLLNYPVVNRWNINKTTGVLILFAIGIFLECYVSPAVLRFALNL